MCRLEGFASCIGWRMEAEGMADLERRRHQAERLGSDTKDL